VPPICCFKKTQLEEKEKKRIERCGERVEKFSPNGGGISNVPDHMGS
jgi:hypothetical protein